MKNSAGVGGAKVVGYSPKGRSIDGGIEHASAAATNPTAPTSMNGTCWSHGAGFGVSHDMSAPPIRGPAARANEAHDWPTPNRQRTCQKAEIGRGGARGFTLMSEGEGLYRWLRRALLAAPRKISW